MNAARRVPRTQGKTTCVSFAVLVTELMKRVFVFMCLFPARRVVARVV